MISKKNKLVFIRRDTAEKLMFALGRVASEVSQLEKEVQKENFKINHGVNNRITKLVYDCYKILAEEKMWAKFPRIAGYLRGITNTTNPATEYYLHFEGIYGEEGWEGAYKKSIKSINEESQKILGI